MNLPYRGAEEGGKKLMSYLLLSCLVENLLILNL